MQWFFNWMCSAISSYNFSGELRPKIFSISYLSVFSLHSIWLESSLSSMTQCHSKLNFPFISFFSYSFIINEGRIIYNCLNTSQYYSNERFSLIALSTQPQIIKRIDTNSKRTVNKSSVLSIKLLLEKLNFEKNYNLCKLRRLRKIRL